MRYQIRSALFLTLILGSPCWADYLVVSRPAHVKTNPWAEAATLFEAPTGTQLPLVDPVQRTNGYYKVTVPDHPEPGWIFRTLARRYASAPPSAVDWGLHIVAFSVGQADSIAVVSPDGQGCLIDAGNDSVAGEKAATFFRDKTQNGVAQISRLKLAFATHYDKDHIGGFPSLTQHQVSIETLVDQGPSEKRHSKPTYTNYLAVADDLDDDAQKDQNEPNFIRYKAIPGKEWSIGDAKIRCVEVRGDTGDPNNSLALDPSLKDLDENPGSIALTITLGKFRLYTGGDQSSSDWKSNPDTEKAILNSQALGVRTHVDVLKVSHHGSDTSSGTNFIKALTPELAVISSSYAKDELPKMVTIKDLAENNPQTIVLVTGDAYVTDTDHFADSTVTHVDDHYSPPSTVHNDVGDVHIYVARDGSTFRVVAGQFTKQFTSTGNTLPN